MGRKKSLKIRFLFSYNLTTNKSLRKKCGAELNSSRFTNFKKKFVTQHRTFFEYYYLEDEERDKSSEVRNEKTIKTIQIEMIKERLRSFSDYSLSDVFTFQL